MDVFKTDLKKWIALDNEIRIIQNKIKKLNDETKSYKDNKEELTHKITNFMRENNMESNVITTSDGSIKFHESVIQSSITLKFLKTSLLQYYENEDEAEKVFNFIKNNRSSKTYFDLHRKIS